MTSGHCVLPGFGCYSPRHTNSDDRIAIALFALALPQSGVASGADDREPTAINLRAAMLFGSPDRQPAAMLAAEFLGHERGDARRYLERTATGKWLVPSFRRIMDWNETSGYGAVETHCAGR